MDQTIQPDVDDGTTDVPKSFLKTLQGRYVVNFSLNRVISVGRCHDDSALKKIKPTLKQSYSEYRRVDGDIIKH